MAQVFFGALLVFLPFALAIAVMVLSITYLDTNEPITLEPHSGVGDATSSSEARGYGINGAPPCRFGN